MTQDTKFAEELVRGKKQNERARADRERMESQQRAALRRERHDG